MAVSPTFRRDTLGVGVPALLADYMVRRGADRADFLAEAGLRPEDLAQGGRISLGANRRLWSIAVGRTGDAALGLHLALLARPGSFGLIEYLARSADSLLAAGRRAAEFARIAHDCISLAVEDEGAHVSVIRQDNDEPTLPHVVDFVMAYLVIVVRQLVGGDPGLLAVDLARQAPGGRRVCPVLSSVAHVRRSSHAAHLRWQPSANASTRDRPATPRSALAPGRG